MQQSLSLIQTVLRDEVQLRSSLAPRTDADKNTPTVDSQETKATQHQQCISSFCIRYSSCRFKKQTLAATDTKQALPDITGENTSLIIIIRWFDDSGWTRFGRENVKED